MPTNPKVPTISEVVNKACRDVRAKKGYDVNAAEGRAFLRQSLFIILRMPKGIAIMFIARCLKYYSKKRKQIR